MTRLWQTADSSQAFAAAMHAAGYVLAQGDKRGFCLVDLAGGVHSLARRIEGVRTKEVTARLAGVDLASLPTVDQVRQQQRDADKPHQDLVRVSGGVDPLLDLALPGAAPQRTEGEASIPIVAITSPRPQAGRQHERTGLGGMEVAATRSEASQRPPYAVEVMPIAAKRAPLPEKSGSGQKGSNTLYSVGIRCDQPMEGVSLARLPMPTPVSISSTEPRPAFIPRGGGEMPPPRLPPRREPGPARPFARLLAPVLGVPQEVIAWVMDAKRRLIAWSCETGACVVPELEHLSRVLSGAYLDLGLTVTGRQRQNGPIP